MKKAIFVAGIMFLVTLYTFAQDAKTLTTPTLGGAAPSFVAESTNGKINFPGDYQNQWKILFSHPADFTPICSTEILELAAMQQEFKAHNTAIIIVSADNLASHNEWKKNLESIRYKDREPVKIDFPLVADPKLDISMKYGMIHPTSSSTKDIRGVFIIDPQNKVRAIYFNPMNVGRNIDEIERMVIALQTADKQQVLIPADWKPGGDVLLPYNADDKSTANADPKGDPSYYKPTWYMTFKKGDK